jgi:hypothetical protein
MYQFAAKLSLSRALAAASAEVLAAVPAADEPTLIYLRDRLGVPIENLDDAPLNKEAPATHGSGLANLQPKRAL